jgi:hypothetical protein
MSVLNKFDMIWDFTPDMMHIIKTFFERLVLGVFSGVRKPKYTNTKPVKPKRKAPPKDHKDYKAKMKKYKARVTEYANELLKFDECYFDAEARQTVDQRVQNLVGYPYWIRASMVHENHTLQILRYFENNEYAYDNPRMYQMFIEIVTYPRIFIVLRSKSFQYPRIFDIT